MSTSKKPAANLKKSKAQPPVESEWSEKYQGAKPTPEQFLKSEGIIFYGTPVPFTEERIHELLTKYCSL